MGTNQTRKFKRRNRWADVLAAIILVGALSLGVMALRDYIKARMLNFVPVSEGSIALTISGELLVLRNEYLLTAPSSGEFMAEAAEGERVKEGGLVGNCGGTPLFAPKGGAISYLLDGWEQKLTIDSFYELDWQQVFQLLREESQAEDLPEQPGEALANLAVNRPVARLVDNLLDYKLLLKLRDPRDLLAEAEKLTFSLPAGKTYKVAFMERWQTPQGDVYYIFNISSSEEAFFSLRYSPVEIIAKEVGGILIPSSAVMVNAEGKKGVYIQKKRKLVFAEIEELTSKDGLSVVSGLDRTAIVVANPEKAMEGQRI